MSKSQPFKMKLKLNTNTPTPAPSASSPPVATPGGSSLKLNFKPLSATSAEPPAQPPPPKEKRKYTKKPKVPPNGEAAGAVSATPAKAPSSKKRKKDGEDESAPARKQAKVPSFSNGAAAPLPPPPPQRTLSIKINQKPAAPKVKSLLLKHKGKPPPRPLGVGYDSEAEDAEIDPAIEAQFILRMQPGEDCDALREAIDQKRVGEDFPVSFRFWDKEGRRVCVRVNEHRYAAIMVDLPCIIEGVKSWDRKGWYKSADICQMLWVLGRIQSDEDAKTYPLPPEVQRVYEQPHGLYQFPHGLTPPMHYVRKRRFRKRVSYRTIEAVEEEVERLIRMDEEVEDRGGTVDDQIIEPEALQLDSEEEVDEDADAEGFEEDWDDGMDLEKEMMMALGAEDEAAAMENGADGIAHEVANQIRNGEAHVVLPTTETTPAASPAVMEAHGETEASSDEDEDDGDDDDEVDEEALARQQKVEEVREEAAELKKHIELTKAQVEQQTNPLLRNRTLNSLHRLQQDYALKKTQLVELGEEEEDD